MIGWLKLHRKIIDHWIWSKPEYFQWWIDILIQANFETKTVLIKNQIIECKRGDVLYSLETWSKRWKTNKSKVRRFLEMLEKDNMIRIKSETVTTRITICKYDSYQSFENDSETQVKQKRNASETQVNPTKESKEVNKGNNNRSFVADANQDEKQFRKYLFDTIKEKQSSRDVLFNNNNIDLSLRNELWESFIKNAILNTPLIENDKHAWNTFKKYVTDNKNDFILKAKFEGFE